MSDSQILIEALRKIRDDRCICGGRFKWSGNQLRCEQCDKHHGYDQVRDIAAKALIDYAEENEVEPKTQLEERVEKLEEGLNWIVHRLTLPRPFPFNINDVEFFKNIAKEKPVIENSPHVLSFSDVLHMDHINRAVARFFTKLDLVGYIDSHQISYDNFRQTFTEALSETKVGIDNES